MKDIEGKSYNSLMQEVQQQFLVHRENTSEKIQQIEDLLEKAVQTFSVLQQRRRSRQEDAFLNPFGVKAPVKEKMKELEKRGN